MPRRLKIAALATKYHQHSHSQHIIDRILEGYGWAGRHHMPPIDEVGLYVDQVGDDDLSHERADRHAHLNIYPTIAETLTFGGSDLAVDGVLLIGEHGTYERNGKGQTLYPRYEFFMEIIKVFESSGSSVPVFNDKHLSWNWDWAKEMYDLSKTMNFAFMAGSSVPVTPRIPSVDMPWGAEVEEAMCISYGGVDSYDFHALEAIQCMVERRKSGESGVEWLEAYRGDRFWEAQQRNMWSPELFESTLARCDILNLAKEGANTIFPTNEQVRTIVEDPIAYHYQHRDGLKCTMILLNGLVGEWSFAARLAGRRKLLSTQMYLRMPSQAGTLATFFSPLVNNVVRMFMSGKPMYPIERTLLTTGLTAAGVESLHQQKRIETPELDITYQAPKTSTFYRS